MFRGALLILFTFAAEAHALTVGNDGGISCGAGQEPVYWQEPDGMPAKYRDIVVIDYPRFEGVLVYQEHANRSMVLANNSAGTNLPWRWLAMPDGESYGTIRGLPVDTSLLQDGGTDYDGKTVDILIIGARLFWPVCAQSSSVERWFRDAEIPKWQKEPT